MKRLLLLYNPHAGDGRVRSFVAGLCEIYTKAGFEVTVHPTQSSRDCQVQIAKRADEFDCIVAAGGDGMLHEAINGLAVQDFKAVLGYLPSGTVNDFANTHRISMDVEEAARQTLDNRLEKIDIGRFNDEYFAYVAACGIATHVSYDTSQIDKKRFGPLAYLVNAMTSVDFQHWENNCESLHVIWDKGEAQGDFIFCSVSNTRYIGGMDNLIDDWFSWNDGLLEGLFIRRPMNLPELNAILSGILRRDYSDEHFVQVQAPWFKLHSDVPVAWTLDGEFGGEHTDVSIHAVEQVLQILLPKAAETSS